MMEYAALSIAFIAFVVSSTLLIMTLWEYRRNLEIYLEWQNVSEMCHLVILNKGRRSVTIEKIYAKTPSDKWTEYPILNYEQRNVLPKSLSYDESVTFTLISRFANQVFFRDMEIELDVLIYDSGKNEYVPTMKREWNPRTQSYSEFVKLERAKEWK